MRAGGFHAARRLRFFGGGVVDLAARMVDMSDVLGRDGRQLRERMGATPAGNTASTCSRIHRRSRQPLPSPEIAFACRRLALTGGSARITALAGEIGWSRKHLVERFRSELGLAPKSIARMMRFHRACRLAQAGQLPAGPGSRPRAACRPGPSGPRIRRTGRRDADGLGAAAGADRRPADAPERSAIGWVRRTGNKSSSRRRAASAY